MRMLDRYEQFMSYMSELNNWNVNFKITTRYEYQSKDILGAIELIEKSFPFLNMICHEDHVSPGDGIFYKEINTLEESDKMLRSNLGYNDPVFCFHYFQGAFYFKYNHTIGDATLFNNVSQRIVEIIDTRSNNSIGETLLPSVTQLLKVQCDGEWNNQQPALPNGSMLNYTFTAEQTTKIINSCKRNNINPNSLFMAVFSKAFSIDKGQKQLSCGFYISLRGLLGLDNSSPVMALTTTSINYKSSNKTLWQEANEIKIESKKSLKPDNLRKTYENILVDNQDIAISSFGVFKHNDLIKDIDVYVPNSTYPVPVLYLYTVADRLKISLSVAYGEDGSSLFNQVKGLFEGISG